MFIISCSELLCPHMDFFSRTYSQLNVNFVLVVSVQQGFQNLRFFSLHIILAKIISSLCQSLISIVILCVHILSYYYRWVGNIPRYLHYNLCMQQHLFVLPRKQINFIFIFILLLYQDIST